MGVKRFVKVDPEQSQYRWYTISWGPTLFGDYAVVRSWGRIGTNWAQCKSEVFEEGNAARVEAEAQTQRRLRRGYRLVERSMRDGRETEHVCPDHRPGTGAGDPRDGSPGGCDPGIVLAWENPERYSMKRMWQVPETHTGEEGLS
jgi:predicted DNA-binding WGR domain protein